MEKDRITPEVLLSCDNCYVIKSKAEDEVLATVFMAMLFERLYHALTDVMEQLCYACQIDDLSQLHHDCFFPFVTRETYDIALDEHLLYLLNDINWNEFRNKFKERTKLATSDHDAVFTRDNWKTRKRAQKLASALGDMFTMLSGFSLVDLLRSSRLHILDYTQPYQ